MITRINKSTTKSEVGREYNVLKPYQYRRDKKLVFDKLIKNIIRDQ